MEKIIRKEDGLFFGNTLCSSPDSAYRLYRKEYESGIGRDANKKLRRLGQRTDILHWKGYDFCKTKWNGYNIPESWNTQVKSRVIGVVLSSYCRVIGCHDMINVTEQESDDYLDWILDSRHNLLRLTNRKNGLGRLNKRQHTHFR